MASISLKYKSKQGSLTAPGDVDPGAMIPIETITVGSGGASSVTFSNIPQNYEHLQLRMIVRSNRSSTLDVAGIQLGSTYYSQAHLLYGDGSSTYSNNSTGITVIAGNTANSGVFGTAIIDFLDYTNTNKYRVAKALSGFDNNGGGNACFGSALWLTTSAINSLSVYPANGTGFTQYSSFTLYGIKRAGA